MIYLVPGTYDIVRAMSDSSVSSRRSMSRLLASIGWLEGLAWFDTRPVQEPVGQQSLSVPFSYGAESASKAW